MAQVTIYLENELEEKMREFVKSKQISQSKWIASLIREKLQTEWPESIVSLAGAWQDLPLAEELRAEMGQDIAREEL